MKFNLHIFDFTCIYMNKICIILEKSIKNIGYVKIINYLL